MPRACPACGYDLADLRDPICPECGREYTPEDFFSRPNTGPLTTLYFASIGVLLAPIIFGAAAWTLAYCMLGRPPREYADDPKDISGVNAVAFLACMFLPLIFPAMLALAAAGVQISLQTRRWKPALLAFVIDAAVLVVLAADPYVASWIMD